MGVAHPPSRLLLRAPVIVAVLAATAVPIDVWSFSTVRMHFGWFLSDAIMNVAGYVPVGIVLGSMGVTRATIIAVLMSVGAEVLQLGMAHRDPSLADIICNVAGALVGIACAVALRMETVFVRLGRAAAFGAAATLLFVVGKAWVSAAPPLNLRGVTGPGRLEAHWKLDEETGRIARDSSGHGLDAEFSTEPQRGNGIATYAPRFDGTPTSPKAKPDAAFRLVGSMTLAAWINASSFPRDDAVIVSTFDHIENIRAGWQMDTTIDRGPRVIGFKLTGSCGSTMARYGATPLQPNVWYHVAAAYDADRQQMHVYLNGKLDDGDLVGSVESWHRSSRFGALIGRRGDLNGFEFSGLINDVRVYSRALNVSEIADLAQRSPVEHVRTTDSAPAMVALAIRDSRECRWSGEPEDARLPALVVLAGISMAILCVCGVTRFMVAGLVASLAIGLLMFYVSTPTLPGFNLWAFPLTALAGALSVLASIRRG
jgi:Concanavalin A-like lectin/glucanases superfamily/VanZ like family